LPTKKREKWLKKSVGGCWLFFPTLFFNTVVGFRAFFGICWQPLNEEMKNGSGRGFFFKKRVEFSPRFFSFLSLLGYNAILANNLTNTF
jgi:hypothetical protein